MASEQRCPNCGAELAPGVAQGLCPKCLMNLGFASQGGSATGSSGPGSSPAFQPTSAFGPGFTAPAVEEVARHFPHLQILELLGQGGMGAVYKARQPKLDRWVALKILPREAAASPGFAERFGREARAMAQLNHPNIVAVYDFGEMDGLFFLMMEFIDGANLRQMVQTQRLTPEQALAIIPQICDALQFAHTEGVVHRDIKPENLLVDKKGRVKIADFGLAKLLGQSPANMMLTGTHQIMGTPSYMAPEQIERPQLVDHRADIYSLGVVLYEMLTGELPLGRFAAPSTKVQVDVRLDEVVFRALEKEPERRYQHASEVKTDVESIVRPHREHGGSIRQPAWIKPASPYASPQVSHVPVEGEVDFLILNPRLPKMAQLICLYGLIIVPILAALELTTFMITIDENPETLAAADLISIVLLSFPLTAILFVGSLRLRALRGTLLLRLGFLCEIVMVPLYIAFLVLWYSSDPEFAAALDTPPNPHDAIGFFIMMLCYGFAWIAFIWLVRRTRYLPLIRKQRSKGEQRPATPAFAASRGTQLTVTNPAQMLMIAVGLVLGALVVAAGGVQLGVALIKYPAGSNEFWGWMGGAFGCIIGGLGAVLGTWNSYRQLEGHGDAMQAGHWNRLDQVMTAYGVAGLVALIAGATLYGRGNDITSYSLLLLGGIVLFQAAIFLTLRFFARRSARYEQPRLADQ